MSDTKKILITGGLGYIGSRLAKDLSLLGRYEITLTTRRSPDKWPDLNISGINIVQTDLMDENDLHHILNGVETIIHLAGPNEKQVIENPLEAIDGSLKASLILLKAAVQVQVKNFYFFSTIHVYGSPLRGHIDENTCPKPGHPYGILNRAVEDYVLMYRKNTDLNAVVFRLSNAFGAPVHKDIDRWSLLVNDLCRMAVEKGEIVLHSDGSQMRDFIPIAQLSQTLHIFMHYNKSETMDGLFNLGGVKTISVLKMAEIVREISEKLLINPIEIKLGKKHFELEKIGLVFSSDKIAVLTKEKKKYFNQEIAETIQFCVSNFDPQFEPDDEN